MINKLIARLKEYKVSWELFNPSNIEFDYNQFNINIDKFLRSNGYYINHSYCDDTLEMSYIIYDKQGNILDLDQVEGIYINPYHSAIESCFKLINN